MIHLYTGPQWEHLKEVPVSVCGIKLDRLPVGDLVMRPILARPLPATRMALPTCPTCRADRGNHPSGCDIWNDGERCSCGFEVDP